MFKLTIDTGNAAFNEGMAGQELARILRTAAEALENGARTAPLRDVNGNRVGRFDFSGPKAAHLEAKGV